MTYSQKTKYYNIPVVGYGDTIVPEVELKKWQVVENLFLACLRGESTAVFAEGTLRLERSGNQIYAIMYAQGNGVICRGMSGGAYFNADKPIRWGPLSAGAFYYLSVCATVKTFDNPSDFDAEVSWVSPLSEKVALVATLDLRGDTYKLDRYPPGKNCPALLMRHIEDNEDPHGELLHQTNLHVDNRLEASTAKINDLTVDKLVLGGNEIRFSQNHLHSIVLQKSLQTGENKILVPNEGFVVFVQSMSQLPITILDDKTGFVVVANEPLDVTFLVVLQSK